MKTIFFDGAFGTYYSYLYNNQDCEKASLAYPDRVLKIHKEYINAGATAIKTNTFGANSTLSENTEYIDKIIKTSFSIAQKAVGEKNIRIFADIGYINEEDTEKEYLRLAQTFSNLGAKDFLFETLAEIKPLIKTIKWIKNNINNSTVIISFACDQNGYTKKGFYFKDLIKQALEIGDYGGLNCLCGPFHIYQLIKEFLQENSNVAQKLIAMPNSSYPSYQNGRLFVYRDNKEYYAERILEIYSLGLGAVGGCCGTTPEHIKIFIDKIISGERKSPSLINEPLTSPTTKKTFGNSLLSKLTSNKKIIACELDSPLDTNIEFMLESAKDLKDAGVDIITIADSPLARAHADSFIIASKLKREIGIEVLPHLSCRDRNHISIKGTLLGANIEGINNVLAITGDPINDSKKKGTFDYNSFTLIEYINKLNEQVFTNNPFAICGALNINSPNFEVELKRAQRKIDGGLKVFLTQPIYSIEGIEKLKKAKNSLDAYILAGIMPIISYKNAMFLNNEVYGIDIPKKITDEFKDKNKEEATNIGLKIAYDIATKVLPYCNGFYIMIPLKRINLICELTMKINNIIKE